MQVPVRLMRNILVLLLRKNLYLNFCLILGFDLIKSQNSRFCFVRSSFLFIYPSLAAMKAVGVLNCWSHTLKFFEPDYVVLLDTKPPSTIFVGALYNVQKKKKVCTPPYEGARTRRSQYICKNVLTLCDNITSKSKSGKIGKAFIYNENQYYYTIFTRWTSIITSASSWL